MRFLYNRQMLIVIAGVLASLNSISVLPAEPIEAQGAFNRPTDRGHFCNIKLGKVPHGQTLDCRLLLAKQRDSDIVYDSTSSTCVCRSITPDQGRIKVGEEMAMSMKVEIPARPGLLTGGAEFVFMNEGKPVAVLMIHYEYENLLAFTPSNLRADIAEPVSGRYEVSAA